ncbi:MAG: hypothetical protein AB1422_00620 [bacterium]
MKKQFLVVYLLIISIILNVVMAIMLFYIISMEDIIGIRIVKSVNGREFSIPNAKVKIGYWDIQERDISYIYPLPPTDATGYTFVKRTKMQKYFEECIGKNYDRYCLYIMVQKEEEILTEEGEDICFHFQYYLEKLEKGENEIKLIVPTTDQSFHQDEKGKSSQDTEKHPVGLLLILMYVIILGLVIVIVRVGGKIKITEDGVEFTFRHPEEDKSKGKKER